MTLDCPAGQHHGTDAMFSKTWHIENVLLCGLLCVLSSVPAFAQTPDFTLQATEETPWRKGNMHTHSLWSDGDDYPEMIARWYDEHNYQFLVFTDHNTLLQGEKWININKKKTGPAAFEKLKAAFPGDWTVTRETEGETEVRLKNFDEVFDRLARPGQFLLIQGEEISDKYKTHPIHLCATNTQELIPPTGGDDVTDVIQRNIEAAISRRERTGVKTLVHLNHPNFGWAITAEQLIPIVGEQFFEVYNGHPTVYNRGDNSHAGTERMWDIVNTWRLAKLNLPAMYGLSTDDGHNYHEDGPGKTAQPGRGWVMVLSSRLDPDSIVDALEAGRFYSSSGVTLESITWKDRQLSVKAQPQEGLTYRIDFIGTRKQFNDETQPASDDEATAAGLTRIYSDDVGAVLSSIDGPEGTYQCDGSELYVRAVVTSSKLHPNPSEDGEFERAWVQPVILLPSDSGQ
ncbi:MAG: hypothetical protein JNL58_22390 [Planctomyces sp.]|nr:hypothetical protein [Planctomyces sp.]